MLNKPDIQFIDRKHEHEFEESDIQNDSGRVSSRGSASSLKKLQGENQLSTFNLEKKESKAYRITYLPPLLNFFITSRASLECICHGGRGRFKSNLNSSIRLVPKLAPTTTPTKITGKICGGLVARFRHFEYTT